MIHLTRTDPSRNKARFYRLDVQRGLFGDWLLIVEWGRIGQAGTTRLTSFANEAGALEACGRAEDRKLRRGYVCSGATGSGTAPYRHVDLPTRGQLSSCTRSGSISRRRPRSWRIVSKKKSVSVRYVKY